MTMRNKPYGVEFMPDEIEAMIPSQVYHFLGQLTPDELEFNVLHNINVDDHYKMEMLWAFSYYETCNEREKRAVKFSIQRIELHHLLHWLGVHKEHLLDKVEEMINRGLPVVQYWNNQLTRCKAMLLTFDELIERKKQYEPASDASGCNTPENL